MKVCVVGLGYVGLTLAVTMAESGIEVLGVDTNKEVIDQLKQGKVYFYEKGLQESLQSNFLTFSDYIKECNYYIICVGTPIDQKTKQPIFDYLNKAIDSIFPFLGQEDTVILRSTVPVGVSRKLNIPCHFAFVPERTVEGNALYECKHIPQVVGAKDDESYEKVVELFSKFNPNIMRLPDYEHAEMLKLIDNTFRDVIFAYSNQMALICDKLGLDIHKIISTANRDYKRSFIPSPSPGVGGACLSKDPHILIDLCKRLGITYKLIQSGRFINEYIPFYLANKVKGGKVFIMGFAFKGDPETSDVRFSPTGELIKYLGNCEIYGYDPLVNLGGRIKSCTIEQGFSDADYVIIMTNHKSFKTLDYPKLLSTAKKDCVLIDWWRMYDTLE